MNIEQNIVPLQRLVKRVLIEVEFRKQIVLKREVTAYIAFLNGLKNKQNRYFLHLLECAFKDYDYIPDLSLQSND